MATAFALVLSKPSPVLHKTMLQVHFARLSVLFAGCSACLYACVCFRSGFVLTGCFTASRCVDGSMQCMCLFGASNAYQRFLCLVQAQVDINQCCVSVCPQQCCVYGVALLTCCQCWQGFSDTAALRLRFENFGPVTECHLPRNKQTGNSKGFAFVKFSQSIFADA